MNSDQPDPRFAKFGEAMWDYITRSGGDFCGEEISEDILPLAEAAGLCCRVEYDPEIHGEDIEAEPGFHIWWWGHPHHCPHARQETVEALAETEAAKNAKPEYPRNVTAFVSKWQPSEDARRKAFWEEFRKAANAYSGFKGDTDPIDHHE